MDITILGIESSCDDTSAAVIRNNLLLSNVIASQAVHIKYGGVIPELASRAHQQNIIPVVDTALKEAGLKKSDGYYTALVKTKKADKQLSSDEIVRWSHFLDAELELLRPAIMAIPPSIIEAAEVDGASRRQTLWHVILPLVMPAITVCTFLTLSGGFKMFDQNLSLTGGDPGKQSQLLALNIYDTFYGRSGPAWKGIGQAKAVVFFVLVVAIALIQLRATSSKEVQA